MSSIRTKFEVCRSIGSRATAPETDASDNLISPIGWAKKDELNKPAEVFEDEATAAGL
jgi:hypothetical protein